MNEEEVKVKYVLPWLKGCGVSVEELEFERSFSVQIGRHNFNVGPGRLNGKAGARLDILVKIRGKNLLIVETKAASLQLTDDDRDQAISYARLVHPMAPYAVVTNGAEYRLYDTLSKALLDPREMRIRGFEASLPEEDLVEAQQLFLRLNLTNLRLLCEQQVQAQLRQVKGSIEDGRKYVPEIHVHREAITKELSSFYPSRAPSLLLVGPSGSGKTSELCAIAESLLSQEQPVFFFNAFSLEKDLLSAVASEFLWTFNGPEQPIQLLKRIESFAGTGFLTIVVDAIDEWTYESRVNHLGALVQAAEGRRIKFIFSCKSSALEQFLSQRGAPSVLSLLSSRFEVGALSPKEFFRALDKYRRAYGFFGSFEDIVLQQARDSPFLLRVLFDVAKHSNVRHLTLSSAEFFEAYYSRAIARTSDARQAANTLIALAQALYDRNSDQVSEREARELLGLRVNEAIMEELFEFGLLLRSAGDPEGGMVGFYFQQLRDYILAFKALRFPQIPLPELKRHLDRVTFPSTRGDVFILYYRLATVEHKELFDRELRQNATAYLACYVQLLQRHFCATRSAFEPHTDGKIGFIGELLIPLRRLAGYGFRAVAGDDEPVHFVPVQDALGRSNLTYLDGANVLHWTSSANGFAGRMNVVSEVVENELIRQLRHLVQRGRLSEHNNRDMLIERVLATVHQHPDVFRSLLTQRGRVRYPLRLAAVLECLRRERLARHFLDEIVQNKRESGAVEERWEGTVVSYSYTLSEEDQERAGTLAEAALRAGESPNIRGRYAELDDMEQALEPAIARLCESSAEISSPPQFVGPARDAPRITNAAPPERDALITDFISAFVANYKTFVERNFPELLPSLPFYRTFPASVYLTIQPEAGASGAAFTPLSLYWVKAKPGGQCVRVVRDVQWERAADSLVFTVDGIPHEGISMTKTTVENIFGTAAGLNYADFRGAPLRSLVYATILRELKDLETALRSRARGDMSSL